MGFLAGVFFLRGYGFGQVIPSGFLPIAISRPTVDTLEYIVSSGHVAAPEPPTW
jgi:hypothetical protein